MGPLSARFRWNKQRRQAAELLAEGFALKEVWEKIGVDERTLRRWRADNTFSDEVDRMTLAAGIASSAERLRIIKRVVRQRVDENTGVVITKKDVLDWLKLAHDETTDTGASLTLNIVGFDQALEKIYGKPNE